MKKILLAITLVLPMAAQAEADCSLLDKLAASVMDGRQNGTTMSEMYAIAEQNKEGEETIKIIVNEAFKVPMYNAESNKDLQVTKFRNRVFLECTKANDRLKEN